MSGCTISDFERELDGLTDELKSSLRNLAAPAFLLMNEGNPELKTRAEKPIDSIYAMLRARSRLDQLLRRAA